MEFDASRNGPWAGAGLPVQITAVDGSQVTALIDFPDNPSESLIPVLLPAVFGKTKEDLGALAELLVAQGCFIVLRPAFLNSGDEARGQLPDLIISGEETLFWAKFLKSDAFRQLCSSLKPEIVVSSRTACVAMSMGAQQALEAQASGAGFDAMVLASFIPDSQKFFEQKTGKTFAEWVRLEWRYRLKTASEPEKVLETIESFAKQAVKSAEDKRRFERLLTSIQTYDSARISDFNVVVDGVPSNLEKALSHSLVGLWDYEWDLPFSIQRAAKVNIPLTFIVGGNDDYFTQEAFDEFLVRSRENGRARRVVRLQDADHRLQPYRCFEQASKTIVDSLFRDLGVAGDFRPLSIARAGIRRFYEVRGFSLRHAKTLGVPVELAQKILLRKEDLVRILDELLSRPDEIAVYLRLLSMSRDELGKPITEFLEPGRLAKIMNGVIGQRHYQAIAAGMAKAPDSAGILFSPSSVEMLDTIHLSSIFASLSDHPDAAITILQGTDPEALEVLGRRKALEAAKRAYQAVPAFRDYLAENEKHGVPAAFEDVPYTDKTNYVNTYLLKERCVGGRLPEDGIIEESSGASGIPTNWVRSRAEDDRLVGHAKLFHRYLFADAHDTRSVVLISGFNQGAWASSTRMSSLGRHSAIVKNIGTDQDKILDTIQRMGMDYRYIIAGYPPFLRELVRAGQERAGFAWCDYKVDILHGGEGYTSSWRNYMREMLGYESRIVSGYGASDLEIGLAFETPLAMDIRERLETNDALREKLLGNGRMPVFFGQYNPLESYMEVREHQPGISTVVTTVTSPEACQPRIRYDIGDEGGIIPFRTMTEFIREHALSVPVSNRLPLPFVYLYGRIDGTISLDGGNVYPSQVEEALFSHPDLVPLVRGFQLKRVEDTDGSVRFHVDIETYKSPVHGREIGAIAERAVADYLNKNNADYRESVINNSTLKPVVTVVEPGTLGIGKTIKNRYIL